MERTTSQTWHIKSNGTSLSRDFNVSYGGIYNISIATGELDTNYSKPIAYHAPPISPPSEFQVVSENNGSYVVNWQERELPANVGKYFYEVLLQEGDSLNETTAQKFQIDKPPFVYTYSSASTYTFAVRIKMWNGLKSETSLFVTKKGKKTAAGIKNPATDRPYWQQ